MGLARGVGGGLAPGGGGGGGVLGAGLGGALTRPASAPRPLKGALAAALRVRGRSPGRAVSPRGPARPGVNRPRAAGGSPECTPGCGRVCAGCAVPLLLPDLWSPRGWLSAVVRLLLGHLSPLGLRVCLSLPPSPEPTPAGDTGAVRLGTEL